MSLPTPLLERLNIIKQMTKIINFVKADTLFANPDGTMRLYGIGMERFIAKAEDYPEIAAYLKSTSTEDIDNGISAILKLRDLDTIYFYEVLKYYGQKREIVLSIDELWLLLQRKATFYRTNHATNTKLLTIQKNLAERIGVYFTFKFNIQQPSRSTYKEVYIYPKKKRKTKTVQE